MKKPDLTSLWPDFQSMETGDLCALYDAALTLDDVTTAIANTPRHIIRDYGGCVEFTQAGEIIVDWGNHFSNIRDTIAAELQKRPVTDWSFMTLVEHVNRLGDDPAEVASLAADLLNRRNAVPQAAE